MIITIRNCIIFVIPIAIYAAIRSTQLCHELDFKFKTHFRLTLGIYSIWMNNILICNRSEAIVWFSITLRTITCCFVLLNAYFNGNYDRINKEKREKKCVSLLDIIQFRPIFFFSFFLCHE